MDESSILKGSASYGILSPQQSQTSSYSSPEMVDLYLNSSSLGGKQLHPGSPGLSSSFVLVTDESAYGEQAPVSSPEYSRPVNIPVNLGGSGTNATATSPSTAVKTNRGCSDTIELEPRALDVATTSTPSSSTPHRIEKTEQTVLPTDSSALPSFASFERVALTTRESGAQTKSDVLDKGTQASLPEPNKEKEGPLCVAPSDRFQVQISPLGSPSEEIVDMSASTVLIERHISQKEGRILKNNNKEMRLKIKKLTEILEQLQNENKMLKNDLKSNDEVKEIRSALEDKERELTKTKELLEQLKGKNKGLNEELRSKSELSIIESALEDKERECRKRIEDLEEQQEQELDQYRERLQRAVEYEAAAKEKLDKNAKEIADLQSIIAILQEQVEESQKEVKKSAEKTSQLIAKLQASETKRTVVESENSVLSEKVDRLMKELSALKHGSGKHHHHHHHHGKKVADPEGSEDITSKQVEPVKRDHHPDVSQQGPDATRHDESSLKHEVRSCPKPKPRQKYYEAHDPHRVNQDVNKVKQKEVQSGRPKPVQALVAPKLQSVAHLQRQLQGASAKYSPSHDHLTPGAAGYDPNRPSYLPVSGQKKAPPMLVPQQTEPTPPLSDAQKLAATASWVQQLPEPLERENECEEEIVPAGARGGEGNDSSSLSEERIEEITRQLKGDKVIDYECPICGKMLHSRESDYGIQLHVELCLQQSERNQK